MLKALSQHWIFRESLKFNFWFYIKCRKAFFPSSIAVLSYQVMLKTSQSCHQKAIQDMEDKFLLTKRGQRQDLPARVLELGLEWKESLEKLSIWNMSIQFSSVQSLSHVWLFATPWTAAHQASLSITNSQSPPKPMSIESVMSSNYRILCHPLLLLPSIFPSIRVFSNESALASGGPSIGVSASISVLPMNTQDWLPIWRDLYLCHLLN